jgi:molybdenum cofactor guanylyltransferase
MRRRRRDRSVRRQPVDEVRLRRVERHAMSVAGILLTGGASRRMGMDKASLVVEGQTAAVRLGAVLASTTSPALEVGNATSGLPSIQETPPGAGPLVAIAAAAVELRRRGSAGPAVVLACDLPLLTQALVRYLVDWDGDGAVVPIVDGRRQPLCARWSAADLLGAIELAASGQRSLRGLPGAGECWCVGPQEWGTVADARAFVDTDSPEDFVRLGIGWRAGAISCQEAP